MNFRKFEDFEPKRRKIAPSDSAPSQPPLKSASLLTLLRALDGTPANNLSSTSIRSTNAGIKSINRLERRVDSHHLEELMYNKVHLYSSIVLDAVNLDLTHLIKPDGIAENFFAKEMGMWRFPLEPFTSPPISIRLNERNSNSTRLISNQNPSSESVVYKERLQIKYLQWQRTLYRLIDNLVDKKLESFYIIGNFKAFCSEEYNADTYLFDDKEIISLSLTGIFYRESCRNKESTDDDKDTYIRCIISGASSFLIKRIVSMGAKCYSIDNTDESKTPTNLTSGLGNFKASKAGKTFLVQDLYSVNITIHCIAEACYSKVISDSALSGTIQFPTLLSDEMFHGAGHCPVGIQALSCPAVNGATNSLEPKWAKLSSDASSCAPQAPLNNKNAYAHSIRIKGLLTNKLVHKIIHLLISLHTKSSQADRNQQRLSGYKDLQIVHHKKIPVVAEPANNSLTEPKLKLSALVKNSLIENKRLQESSLKNPFQFLTAQSKPFVEDADQYDKKDDSQSSKDNISASTSPQFRMRLEYLKGQLLAFNSARLFPLFSVSQTADENIATEGVLREIEWVQKEDTSLKLGVKDFKNKAYEFDLLFDSTPSLLVRLIVDQDKNSHNQDHDSQGGEEKFGVMLNPLKAYDSSLVETKKF